MKFHYVLLMVLCLGISDKGLSQPIRSENIRLSHDSIYVRLSTENEKSKAFEWGTLIPTILGGLLVFIGQWIERNKTKERDKKKEYYRKHISSSLFIKCTATLAI